MDVHRESKLSSTILCQVEACVLNGGYDVEDVSIGEVEGVAGESVAGHDLLQF
jgi:hypothetical protein